MVIFACITIAVMVGAGLHSIFTHDKVMVMELRVTELELERDALSSTNSDLIFDLDILRRKITELRRGELEDPLDNWGGSPPLDVEV